MDLLNSKSTIGDIMEEPEDIVLEQLREAVTPVIDAIDNEQDNQRAIFVLGAKEITKTNGDYEATQTFIDVCGDYGVLGEALYNELMSSIEEKRPELFELFRQVVKTIEEELELGPNDIITEQRTLH